MDRTRAAATRAVDRITTIAWTDGRVMAILIVIAIALTTALAGNAASTSGTAAGATTTETPSAETAAPADEEPVANAIEVPGHETGTAAWALALLGRLDSYETPPDERYDRDTYDNGWRDADGDCQSGRHEVLIEESLEPVEFVDGGACKVEAGLWIDPYSGDRITHASEASIDHVVSLANAHRSGAWQWSLHWRRAFANDLNDPATLAVSATAVNGSKGSAAPDTWMPAGAEARCHYAIAWVRVKTRWRLATTAAERQTLVETLDACVATGLPETTDATPLVAINLDKPVPMEAEPTPVIGVPGECDDRYPSICIPRSQADLDCVDIAPRRFAVDTTDGADPHNFDGDHNGIGCER